MDRFVDMRLKHNASMMVAGPSQSGKTTFIRQLLKYRNILFDKPMGKIYWFYGVYQPELHYQLREEGVEVTEGLPDNFNNIESNSIIVLDDLMSEAQKAKDKVTQLFTRMAHHRNCFIILVSQNLFERGAQSRTQHLNTQYYVVFKNPRDVRQVIDFGSQMYPGKPKYLPAVFKDATLRPHGYLFMDNVQLTDDDLRLRTNILPQEKPMLAYCPKL